MVAPGLLDDDVEPSVVDLTEEWTPLQPAIIEQASVELKKTTRDRGIVGIEIGC